MRYEVFIFIDDSSSHGGLPSILNIFLSRFFLFKKCIRQPIVTHLIGTIKALRFCKNKKVFLNAETARLEAYNQAISD